MLISSRFQRFVSVEVIQTLFAVEFFMSQDVLAHVLAPLLFCHQEASLLLQVKEERRNDDWDVYSERGKKLDWDVYYERGRKPK